MRCGVVQRRMLDAVDGDLKPAVQEGLFAHLRACSPCRAKYRALQQGLEQLNELPLIEPRDDLADRIELYVMQRSTTTRSRIRDLRDVLPNALREVWYTIYYRPLVRYSMLTLIATIIIAGMYEPPSSYHPNPATGRATVGITRPAPDAPMIGAQAPSPDSGDSADEYVIQRLSPTQLLGSDDGEYVLDRLTDPPTGGRVL